MADLKGLTDNMVSEKDIKSKKERINYIILTITIFAGFLIFGFSENIKGPAIPRIQADFSLSEFQIGLLLATNSFAYLLACFYTAGMARKIGLKATLIICLAGMAASGAGICFSSDYPALVTAYFIMYLGNGMLEITLGVMAANIFVKNTGTMMSLSHFFYGLSSAVAPILAASMMEMRFSQQTLGWRYMYLIVLLWSLIPIIPAVLGKINKNTDNDAKISYKLFLENKKAWLIILILSLAVTSEMSVGGWLVNFSEKAYLLTEAQSAVVLTGFFICFMLARLLFGPIIDKIGFTKSLLICTAFSGFSIIAGVLIGKAGIGLLIASGFGVAPVYPIVMSMLAKIFKENIDSAMTVTLTIMGIVIVIGNLLVGAIVDASKLLFGSIAFSYSVGYVFIGLCSAAAFFVTLNLYRKLKRENELI